MEQVSSLIHGDYAKNTHLSGKGITIAYLDSGISMHHDFLKPSSRLLFFKDFVNQRTSPYDDNGHGTHVTGIAASSRIGIAPASNILSLKVLNRQGNGKAQHMIRCFQWLLKYKDHYQIRIVNISIGMEADTIKNASGRIIDWVERLWDAGLIVCIAGGNFGPAKSSITIPGNSKKVITVGASDDMTANDYSGRGPTNSCIVKPDITAPGTDILSCYGSSHYIKRSGTSMATPIVSGAIALCLEKNPAMTNKMIKLKLRSSCDDLGYPRNQQGWGRLNLEKFLCD
jgi:serine protease AprX